MLREITIEELPEANIMNLEPTPDGLFAEEAVLNFATSEIMIAEVIGWPTGDPTDSKDASRKQALLNNKIRKHKLEGVNALSRQKRLFLQKTIIRKAGEVDG